MAVQDASLLGVGRREGAAVVQPGLVRHYLAVGNGQFQLADELAHTAGLDDDGSADGFGHRQLAV